MSVRAEPHCVTIGLFDNPTSLIYGIGNDGRQDDGLGWAFIERLEQIRPRPHACLRRTYQLSLEDADLISRYSRVLFVDATKDPAVESFSLSRPQPKLDFSFTRRLLAGDPRLRMGTPAGIDRPRATQPRPLTGVLVETAVAPAATNPSTSWLAAAFISQSGSKRYLFMSTVFDKGDATGIAGFRRG